MRHLNLQQCSWQRERKKSVDTWRHRRKARKMKKMSTPASAPTFAASICVHDTSIQLTVNYYYDIVSISSICPSCGYSDSRFISVIGCGMRETPLFPIYRHFNEVQRLLERTPLARTHTRSSDMKRNDECIHVEKAAKNQNKIEINFPRLEI